MVVDDDVKRTVAEAYLALLALMRFVATLGQGRDQCLPQAAPAGSCAGLPTRDGREGQQPVQVSLGKSGESEQGSGARHDRWPLMSRVCSTGI